jgi:MYXO-CTERM domain-containing protein
MKRVFASCIALVAMLFSTQIASAGAVIPFTVGTQTQNIDSFLYNSGNTIAQGAIPGALTVGSTFNFFYQATLATPQLAGGNVNYTALNSTTFITAVIGGTETVTSVSGPDSHGNVTSTFALTTGTSYFDLYASSTKPNALKGTGFNFGEASSNLILHATLTAESGSFAVNTNNTVKFNIATSNPTYPASTTTLQSPTDSNGVASGQPGGGHVTITASVISASSTFFPGQLSPGTTLVMTFAQGNTTGQFQQTPPTNQFVTGTDASGLVKPSIGAINGKSGPDYMFQTNGSQSFTVTGVPEPSSMVLAVMGVGGLALARLRRRRAAL